MKLYSNNIDIIILTYPNLMIIRSLEVFCALNNKSIIIHQLIYKETLDEYLFQEFSINLEKKAFDKLSLVKKVR